MSCMVPVNSTEASERDCEALLRRREEKMALTPFKLVGTEKELIGAKSKSAPWSADQAPGWVCDACRVRVRERT